MSEQISLSDAIKMGILGSPRLKVVGMRKRAGEMSEQAEKQLTLHEGKAVLTAEMPSATVVCASLDEARAAAKLINEANIAVPLASYQDGYIAGGTNTRTLIAKVLHSGTSKDDEAAILN
eukprot:16274-Heterococcus_DN1.PRE.1